MLVVDDRRSVHWKEFLLGLELLVAVVNLNTWFALEDGHLEAQILTELLHMPLILKGEPSHLWGEAKRVGKGLARAAVARGDGESEETGVFLTKDSTGT